MARPEYQAPPEFYYNEEEARKYTRNSRIIEVQSQLSERALEILALPEGRTAHLLDLGCGSALSAAAIEEAGHSWIGVDISPAMLDVASTRGLESGDLVLCDLGQGLPFRPGTFDGAISISALQWLCNADKKSHNPVQRLKKLFESLYSCLSRGSRAVFQFYPEDDKQVTLITTQAMRAGFTGGLLVDYPNSTKAKKVYLVLFTGGDNPVMPKPLMNEHDMSSSNGAVTSEIANINRRMKQKPVRGKPPKKSRDWILAKKERNRRQGKEVRADTKYTGRKRSGRF